MAVIKCKMCGGDLVLIEGQSVAECEYCGSKQTVPAADNEKKLNLFASANKLRAACEFDRAAGIYDAIKAEFPSEAEAYWGLVLCKYGIEYVDDPATGKKVPTCHRLSYDNVMDDANLDLAMDCADAVARKVYREEAKHLEKIRTGILEVSSNEKPYDIFICYKETDENGDRTLDSVLAQDIYSALADKGYRVFFSRITLQSKLGEVYEPYIFAALNSAKVMLAIGTDPEYYSAVWVKNEWSRYLKICAADKSKHLIPCYKDMDAYDMPKEFRPLQGVDLGKMGAVQDILFNMEKYIPLKKRNTTVMQEKVVVGGTGGSNKIASLLDRGNMALEDGDWAKADSFFEDVLNNDSKNAQAYIGKTLVQERCRTMDALVRKRKDVYQNVSSEKLYIKAKDAHINQMAEQYSLPGYVDKNTIRELYRFDLSYTSEVSNRQKQYREEESWWQNHRQLSRAEKFAVGAVAEHLQSEKKHLFAQLNDRVKKAQEADAHSVAKLEAAYDAHIAEADQQAEKMYNDGLTHREKDYQNWLSQAKTETVPSQLLLLTENFVGLGEYQDSKKLAEHCRKRAVAEQAKIDAENERQRVIAEQKQRAREKQKKILAMIAAGCVLVAIAGAIVVKTVIIPWNDYKAAITLKESGEYWKAISAFNALGDYRDSSEQVQEIRQTVKEAQDRENEEKRKAEAARQAEKRKAEEERMSKEYAAAEELEKNGEIYKAAVAFYKLRHFQDARERCFELWGKLATQDSISACEHTVGVKADGTVAATTYTGNMKYYYGECEVSDWKNIIAVSAGWKHTAGLRENGTVVATKYTGEYYDGQSDVSGWRDIVDICTSEEHTFGLKADGTVVVTNYKGILLMNQIDIMQYVSVWKDIVDISAGGAGGREHFVALQANGKVTAMGSNDAGQCEVSDWKDIVSVSAGANHTVGLKSDGTVVAVGSNGNGQCDVSRWKNIVAVRAGFTHTVGLKADGTVVVAAKSGASYAKVTGWKDIVAISAGDGYTVGLKSDGTVVAVGTSYDGGCNVSDWHDMKLPEM